jgi:hypothetical protein
MPKTTGPAAAAEKAVEKPYKLMTSADVAAEAEERKVTPRVPGPQTGEVQRSPGQWLEHYGTPEELRAFKSVIETRLKAAPADQWRALPDGSKMLATLVLAGCPAPPGCGRWFWVKKAEGPCVCNLRGDAHRGHLRPATEEEVAEWFARETAAAARFKADAPKRQAEQKAFDLRRIQDGKV